MRRQIPPRRFLGTLALSALLIAGSAAAGDWPSIRGPKFDGSGADVPTELTSGALSLNVTWKRSLGSGYSGVAKSGQRLVTAMADSEAGQEFVVALSAKTGETLWRSPTGPIMKGENGSFDGPIATPAVDSARVYHLSPFGVLSAHGLNDGALIWSHDFKAEYSSEPNFYGFGASPIVVDDLVVIAAGGQDGAIMAFESDTGRVAWAVGEDGAAFQSPIVTTLNDQNVIIATGNSKLMAIQPQTGDLLWEQPHSGGERLSGLSAIPVPVPGGGVFLNDGHDETTVWSLSNDGAAKHWSTRQVRNSYCVPVMSNGLLCAYSSRVLVAVDPQTGKRVWRSRAPKNGFLATLGDRLVVATLEGSLHVGDVSEDGFDEVAAVDVFDAESDDGLMWALPSVADGSVYLRSLGAIARIDITAGEAATVVAATSPEVSPAFEQFLKRVDAATDKQTVVDAFLADQSTPIIDGDIVHFVFQGDDSDVVVASDLFGMRQERVMQRVDGTDLFYFAAKVEGKTRVSYVFFADYKPIVDPRNERTVVSSTVTNEMEPTFMGPGTPVTFSWFDKGDVVDGLTVSVDAVPESLNGSIQTLSIESQSMNETVPVSVYLPKGYSDAGDAYPVVFVHDGLVAMERGHQAAIVDQLITAEQIPPVVVVFIGKSFYPTVGANGYPAMFTGELIPLIEDTFHVSSEPSERASLGGGFGGTLAMMGTLPAGGQIGRIGLQSPYAFELLHPVLTQLASIPGDRVDVLIQSGRFEYRNPSENWDMARQAEAIDRILSDAGHRVTREPTDVGTDWVSWRTQSVRVWTFLLAGGS